MSLSTSNARVCHAAYSYPFAGTTEADFRRHASWATLQTFRIAKEPTAHLALSEFCPQNPAKTWGQKAKNRVRARVVVQMVREAA
jgi:hypothetical protein